MSGNVPQHPVSQHHLLQHRRDATAGRSMERMHRRRVHAMSNNKGKARVFVCIFVAWNVNVCVLMCLFSCAEWCNAFWISKQYWETHIGIILGLETCWPACIGATWLNISIPEGNFRLRAWVRRPKRMIFCGVFFVEFGSIEQGLRTMYLCSWFPEQVWRFVFWIWFVQKLTLTNRDGSSFSEFSDGFRYQIPGSFGIIILMHSQMCNL